MLHQAGVEQGLSAEQGHGVEERGEELVHLPCGLWGAPGRLELVGWRGGGTMSQSWPT